MCALTNLCERAALSGVIRSPPLVAESVTAPGSADRLQVRQNVSGARGTAEEMADCGTVGALGVLPNPRPRRSDSNMALIQELFTAVDLKWHLN